MGLFLGAGVFFDDQVVDFGATDENDDDFRFPSIDVMVPKVDFFDRLIVGSLRSRASRYSSGLDVQVYRTGLTFI